MCILPSICTALFNVKFFISVDEKKQKTVVKIENAKRKIRYEITELSERLKQKKQTIHKLKDEISKLETPVAATIPKIEPVT